LSFGVLERKWDGTRSRRGFIFDDRRAAENLIGREGDGFKIAMAALDGGRLNIAACSLGGASQPSTARVHGEPQGVRARARRIPGAAVRLADMATQQVSRTFLGAAAALDAKAPSASTLCAMAKRVVTDAGFAVANVALQLHGGRRILAANMASKRSFAILRVHQILEGTNEIMRVIIARALVSIWISSLRERPSPDASSSTDHRRLTR
jgi:alkylation response protein AidB-like acyl-CoA dehydrogenase